MAVGQTITPAVVNGTLQTGIIQVREGFKAASWLLRYVGQFYDGGGFNAQAFIAATSAPGVVPFTVAEANALNGFAVAFSNAGDVYYGVQQKANSDNTGAYLERNLAPLQ